MILPIRGSDPNGLNTVLSISIWGCSIESYLGYIVQSGRLYTYLFSTVTHLLSTLDYVPTLVLSGQCRCGCVRSDIHYRLTLLDHSLSKLR